MLGSPRGGSDCDDFPGTGTACNSDHVDLAHVGGQFQDELAVVWLAVFDYRTDSNSAQCLPANRLLSNRAGAHRSGKFSRTSSIISSNNVSARNFGDALRFQPVAISSGMTVTWSCVSPFVLYSSSSPMAFRTSVSWRPRKWRFRGRRRPQRQLPGRSLVRRLLMKGYPVSCVWNPRRRIQ